MWWYFALTEWNFQVAYSNDLGLLPVMSSKDDDKLSDPHTVCSSSLNLFLPKWGRNLFKFGFTSKCTTNFRTEADGVAWFPRRCCCSGLPSAPALPVAPAGSCCPPSYLNQCECYNSFALPKSVFCKLWKVTDVCLMSLQLQL